MYDRRNPPVDQSAAGFGQLTPFAFHVDASTRVGILTIHSFDVDNANEWKAFLHRTLAELKARHARALVIDVRQNSGGDTDLSDDLLRIFARTSFRDFSEVDAKISAVTKRALGHDRYIEIYGPDAWSATDGTTLIEPIAYENPLPRNARFPGKVYVLVGSGTYSTAAIFAAAAQDSHSATIVGQESGGLPTLYGEAFPFTLPESGISATVSTKYLVRADSDRRPHGVIPDKDFQETPEGQRDSELKSAVELAAGR